MPEHPDVAAFVARLTSLPGTAFDASVHNVRDLGDDVAHLAFFVGGPDKRFDLVFSRNGLRLADLAETMAPPDGSRAVVFVEDNSGDRISHPFFDYTLATGVSDSLFSIISPVVSEVRSTLGLTPDAFRALVRGQDAERSRVETSVMSIALSTLAEVFGVFDALLGDFVELVNSKAKAPSGLYQTENRSAPIEDTVSDAGVFLDGVTAQATALMQQLPLSDAAAVFEEAVGKVVEPVAFLVPDPLLEAIAFVRDMLGKLDRAWAKLRGLLTEFAAWIEKHRPQGEHAVNAVLGYLCGLWDGVVDAVTGIAETLRLVVGLLAAELRRQADPFVSIRLVGEATDQLIQTIADVDFGELLDFFMDELAPVLVEFVEKELDRFGEDLAEAGYFIGYLAYNLLEFLLPPLKLTKFAKGLSMARESARRIAQVLG